MTYLQAVKKYCKENDVVIRDADDLYQYLRFLDSMIDHYADLYKSTVIDVNELLDKLREMDCDPEFLKQFRYIG